MEHVGIQITIAAPSRTSPTGNWFEHEVLMPFEVWDKIPHRARLDLIKSAAGAAAHRLETLIRANGY